MSQTHKTEVRSIAHQLAALYEALDTPAERETFRSTLNNEIARARRSIRRSACEMITHFLNSEPDQITVPTS